MTQTIENKIRIVAKIPILSSFYTPYMANIYCVSYNVVKNFYIRGKQYEKNY